MPPRSLLLAAGVLCALAIPASASAATWTQQSTIINQTGSTFANCSAVPGLGCMDLSAWSNNAGTTWTQQPQGQIPAAAGAYDGTAQWGTSNNVHGDPLQSEVQYLLPDQTTWVMDTDVNYGDFSGVWTASCGVYQGQSSQYGCVPTASGDSSLTTASYTFAPLGSASTVAAGASC